LSYSNTADYAELVLQEEMLLLQKMIVGKKSRSDDLIGWGDDIRISPVYETRGRQL